MRATDTIREAHRQRYTTGVLPAGLSGELEVRRKGQATLAVKGSTRRGFKNTSWVHHARAFALVWSWCVWLAASSCSPGGGTASLGPPQTPPPSQAAPEPEPSADQLPVDADDAVWGRPTAPVTVLVFTDLQCPFCAQGHAVLIELERHYGEGRLRVVIKHVPLAVHEGAIPAARVAQAVLALGGRGLFFRYLDLAFANQDKIADGRALEVAGPLGLDAKALTEQAESAEIGRQILRDVALAERIQVTATPHYRINGLSVTGAEPFRTFERLIDAELAEAQRLLQSGTLPNQIYSRRVASNLNARASW